MPITSLEIKDKKFSSKFRGFDPEEVDEFLDIVVRDYETLVRSNYEKEQHIKNLEERLSYFDEIKDEAKYKANEILRQATDNAKKVAIETEELKNKSRVFHQRLKSTIESQLAIVDSPDWEEILRPTATYLQTSDEAFKEVVEEVLGEDVSAYREEESIDMTRQFSPEEVAELQARIEAANRELAETQKEATPLKSIDEGPGKTEQSSYPTPLTESIDLL